MKDPIVEEVRRIRAEIATEHGNDLHRIFEDARRRQGAAGRRVISFDAADRDQQSCIVREDRPSRDPELAVKKCRLTRNSS